MTGITSRKPARPGALLRLVTTAISIVVVETIVCGLALLPAMSIWQFASRMLAGLVPPLVIQSVTLVPCYVIFALTLMVVSSLATWLTGARTLPNLELHIADMDWRLMRWVRYVAAIHIVRVFAGTLFRGSPLWTAYLRWNGARMGRGVYVNSLFVSDHNLLDFGDGVVIGSEVHISGHTVERGIVKTAPVTLGDHVTIGVGSTIEIGVTIGRDTQIGALSFVPKHTTLPGAAVYVGAPVKQL